MSVYASAKLNYRGHHHKQLSLSVSITRHNHDENTFSFSLNMAPNVFVCLCNHNNKPLSESSPWSQAVSVKESGYTMFETNFSFDVLHVICRHLSTYTSRFSIEKCHIYWLARNLSADQPITDRQVFRAQLRTHKICFFVCSSFKRVKT